MKYTEGLMATIGQNPKANESATGFVRKDYGTCEGKVIFVDPQYECLAQAFQKAWRG